MEHELFLSHRQSGSQEVMHEAVVQVILSGTSKLHKRSAFRVDGRRDTYPFNNH